MNERLTYGKLFDYLRSLGYNQRSVCWNNREQWVFHHEGFEKASIFLPQWPLHKVVETTHLDSVRATLHAYGLIDTSAQNRFDIGLT